MVGELANPRPESAARASAATERSAICIRIEGLLLRAGPLQVRSPVLGNRSPSHLPRPSAGVSGDFPPAIFIRDTRSN